MRPNIQSLALSICTALAACSTAPPAPDPILTGRTQALVLHTDPPGAACTIVHDGMVVAAIGATPGVAAVPRDFSWSRYGIAPRPDAIPPIEISCRKEGYLDYRRAFAVAWAHDVAIEQSARREASAGEEAMRAVGGTALAAGAVGLQASAGSIAMIATAAPAAVIAPLAVAVIVGIAAAKDAPPRATLAYRALPEFLLTPATFDSEASCDAYFATLKLKLETARDAMRARIDSDCRFYPCKSSDPTPCPDPVCERLRVAADEQLQSELGRIPELRAQVRVTASPR